MASLDERVVREFGEQWSRYPDNDGYYGSLEMLRDILGPLLPIEDLVGVRVGEIGSGTGRIVQMLASAGAASIVALEPSEACEALRRNVMDLGERVSILRARGEEIPAGLDLDFVFSIGVLHHIPDPRPVVRAAFEALRPGGKIVVWLYGREGNEAYLAVAGPLRRLTTHLPHAWLSGLSFALALALDGYILAARLLPLPLAAYVRGTLQKLSRDKRKLVIYDQLNPSYAKHYRREEVARLLATAGFEEVSLHHRHGYSWTAVGRKP